MPNSMLFPYIKTLKYQIDTAPLETSTNDSDLKMLISSRLLYLHLAQQLAHHTTGVTMRPGKAVCSARKKVFRARCTGYL